MLRTLSVVRAALAAATSFAALTASAQEKLPDITVEAQAAVKAPTKAAKEKPPSVAKSPSVPAPASSEPAAADTSAAITEPAYGERRGSLGVATTDEARFEIERTPGAVEVVPDTAYKSSTPATTIKDALDYVPGVFVQPKWGEDSRLSIRGSGLSRNFHLRGLLLLMDAIPINTADGFGDFQEIDPTAYRYLEVYKGGNALRFGGNSLGGAINFVMPTGYDSDLFGVRADAGSFGLHKLSVSSGAVSGAVDYALTATFQEQDGFRDHSAGESIRGSLNLGYRLSPNVETRFYINANDVDQRIPGSVTKAAALASPEAAAAINVINDWQRNIDTVRIANKTTAIIAPGTTIEIGVFGVDRHLMHPIFQWIDYRYDDAGSFARVVNESTIGGIKNRLIAGANLHYGTADADQYANIAGNKGALLSSSENTSRNVSAYIEDTFTFAPGLSFVAGTQFLHAERELDDKFLADGDQSGQNTFSLWSPKVGLLWDVTRNAQVFANVSRSAEVPSFGENSFASVSAFDARAQRATTYEIGTRGSTEGFTWDLAFYRADIENELQCSFPFGVATFCIVRNADQTIHQGIEAGFGAALLKGLVADGERPDRLWLNAAYTFSDFRFDRDPVYGNNELPGAPRHYLRAELLYKHPSGVYFGPNVEWVPEAYFVDSANTLETKAYAIWGAKLGYETEKYALYIEGRNLADEAYIASTGITNVANPATTALFEPGNGRAVYGGVQVKW